MSEVLSLNTDFSLYHSLKELEKAAPTNPDFEITLKRNISNDYCTQPCYELVNYIFKAEGEVVFNWLLNADMDSVWNFEDEYNTIIERFMNTPLENMKSERFLKPQEVLLKAAKYMQEII
jgi:hypothetical protein